VSIGGDINDDGYDDMIISAPYADNYKGIIYVIYGDAATRGADIDLSNASTYNGFRILGANIYDSAVSVGDINDDEYVDMIISAPWTDNYKGIIYVIYGDAFTRGADTDLSNASTYNGFQILGANIYDYAGGSVSVGDINDDEYDDMIISASCADNYKGISYVIYGGDHLNMAIINLENFSPSLGFAIRGAISAYNAGDVDKDGYDDILISAFEQIYLVYGFSTDFAIPTFTPSVNPK